ncbi:hypothetical protein CRG98_001212 [Punica granatum]|uniref:Uncharacterized protein n=1 Tax=Punica granatum TaxID=22663 RepID=A0A2I0LCJ0_PUNGR|nr:hypothetical protein CRG98_001212 [Punica granatum]
MIPGTKSMRRRTIQCTGKSFENRDGQLHLECPNEAQTNHERHARNQSSPELFLEPTRVHGSIPEPRLNPKPRLQLQATAWPHLAVSTPSAHRLPTQESPTKAPVTIHNSTIGGEHAGMET